MFKITLWIKQTSEDFWKLDGWKWRGKETLDYFLMKKLVAFELEENFWNSKISDYYFQFQMDLGLHCKDF